MVGDACAAAKLATIPVEILLRDGRRLIGTPSPQLATDENQQVDETGYANLLRVDGAPTRLEDVIEFVVRTP